MRHQKSLRKFGRSASHRKAMFRNMATSLLREERIQTTISKAKDLRRVVEKLITLAGNGDSLHARRQAYAVLNSKPVVHKLFEEIGPRYKKRPGGYTRVVRVGQRASDSAELAVIELVEEELPKKKKAKKSSRAGSRGASKKKAEEKPAAKKATAKKADEAEEPVAEEAAAEETDAAVEAEAVEEKPEEEKKEE